MDRTELEELKREFVDALWTGHDWSVADRLIPPDFDNGPDLPPGPEGTRRWHESTGQAFPDLRYELVEVVCDPEGHAAFRWRAQGTHLGDFGPVPPTGRLIRYEGAHFIRVREGKIREMWSINDTFGKLQQMGVQMTPPSRDEAWDDATSPPLGSQ